MLGDPAQRGGGDAVVVVREALPGGGGEHELLGRPAPATRAGAAHLAGLHQLLGEHGVEVLADRGGAQAQLGADLGGRGGAPLHQQVGDPVTGATVRRGGRSHRTVADHHLVFHYANVTYFLRPLQTEPR